MTARKRSGPGGKRKGAGRPAKSAALKRGEVVKVLLTRAERAVMEARVSAENEAVDDGSPATLSSWLRDLALDQLGLPTPTSD